jgi:hypothetical protein
MRFCATHAFRCCLAGSESPTRPTELHSLLHVLLRGFLLDINMPYFGSPNEAAGTPIGRNRSLTELSLHAARRGFTSLRGLAMP